MSAVPSKPGNVRELVPKARVTRRRHRASLVPLIGRADTLERIAKELAGGARVVTLTGPPGIGKTRVATACLEELAPAHARGGGAWFCDLSQIKTERDMTFAVLALLTERAHGEHLEESEVEARLDDVLAAAGPTLLVLDNFEQLVVAARAVERWCRAAPRLSVLVTSRERLAIEGEVVIELAPLPFPAQGDDADAIEASDAVKLFIKRARDAGGAIGADPRVLASIVRSLEGIPLAIELAAARTRLLSVGELAERLAAGHGVLTQMTRRAESRHATLASAIEWSWSLLSEEEQVALARCSVFAGSFGVQTAEAVIDRPNAVELLGALRDKSLVHPTDDGRLALYVSIRDYALDRLGEQGHAEPLAAQLRHARALGDLARRFNASRSLQGTAPEPGLSAAVRAEKENLAAALAFVRSRPMLGHDAPLRAELAVASALLHLLPGEACAAELGDALRALGDGHPTLAAQILLARQSVSTSLGRYADCLADLTALGAMPNVPRGFALLALVYRGIQLRYQGLAHQAWQAHAEAAAELETAGLPRLRAMNEACMGRLRGDLGDFALSHLHNERAFELCDAVGDSWLGALALANLAQLEQEEGRLERSRELLLAAIERLRSAGEVHYEAIYSGACGDLFFEWGKHDVARRWYAEGARLLRGFLAHRQTAVLHGAAAALEAHDGDHVKAREHLDLARRSALRGANRVALVVVELHTASVEIALADDAARERVVRDWQVKLDRLSLPGDEGGEVVATSFDARFALRMAQRAILRALPLAQIRTLRAARDGGWFEIAGEGRVELGRRGVLRRLLLALVEHHATHPNRGLDVDALVRAGWPGERVLADAAATRVRVAIATLRRLGLRSMLLTREDGYVLDPHARVVVGG